MTDTKLLIVADDLTGGLDTGVQFARQGIKVRVSVDHGTAFDQAGKGSADQASLRNAIDYAVRLAAAKKR